MGVEASDQMLGGADVQGMLAEGSAHRFAQRPLAGAAVADEDEGDFGLLVGVLHAPSNPVDVVLVNALIAVGQHLTDMLAHSMPIALLWLDAPAGPQIEPTFDDRRCCRLEDYAAILPPLGMREPPLAEGRRLFAAIIDDAIEVQVAEIIEAQEGGQTVDVMLTSDLALVRLEAQHQGPSAVEHHAIFGVELREQPFGFFLFLPPLLLLCRLFLGVGLPRSRIDHQLFEDVGAQPELFGCSLALALVFDG